MPAVTGAVSETELMKQQEKIEEFWRREFVSSGIAATGGVRLQYAARRETAGHTALVVVSGRTEFMEKYAELFYDLREAGLSFYIYDHRGQGSSQRLLADPRKGHVDSFADYVNDLEIFLATVVRPDSPRHIVLLSHSMGGTISLLYAEAHRQALSGLILSSPMFSINTRPVPGIFARFVSRVAVLAGRETDYVVGAGPWVREPRFENNRLTGSRARFERNRRFVAENPALALGGPTFGWLAQSFAVIGELREREISLRLPVLLLQGEADRVVGLSEPAEICGRFADCKRISFPGGRHELLMETDGFRTPILEEVGDFLVRIGR